MDGTFHAIATILHRSPREAGDLRGKRKAGKRRTDNLMSSLQDISEGWIRVAL